LEYKVLPLIYNILNVKIWNEDHIYIILFLILSALSYFLKKVLITHDSFTQEVLIHQCCDFLENTFGTFTLLSLNINDTCLAKSCIHAAFWKTFYDEDKYQLEFSNPSVLLSTNW